MKTFGQVIVEARKAASLTQKAVAERLCRGDGRKVLPPWLNDLEHDRRYPPENAVIEQLAELLHISADILYFYARRVPGDISGDFDDNVIEAGYRAFRKELQGLGTSTTPYGLSGSAATLGLTCKGSLVRVQVRPPDSLSKFKARSPSR